MPVSSAMVVSVVAAVRLVWLVTSGDGVLALHRLVLQGHRVARRARARPLIGLWRLMKPASTAELKPISVLKMLPTPVANEAKLSDRR